MHDLVVRGGLVVSAAGVRHAEIAVRDGRIAEVGTVTGPARRVVDATGLHVLPGGVEPHMHVENDFLGLSTAHDFYTQSVAAAHGGVTTFFDFANTAPGGSLPESVAARREQMAKSAIDFAVHGRVLETGHLAGLAEAVAAGCPSFKLYLTYPEVGLMADDRTVLAAFRAARETGALPLVHAESEPIAAALTEEARCDGDLSWSRYPDTRPPLCEAEAFARVVRFARLVGNPLYVVHTSVAEAVAEARRAKRAGLRLHVETCPQYLVLTRRLYDDPDRGMLAICAPPLRDPAGGAGPLARARRRDHRQRRLRRLCLYMRGKDGPARPEPGRGAYPGLHAGRAGRAGDRDPSAPPALRGRREGPTLHGAGCRAHERRAGAVPRMLSAEGRHPGRIGCGPRARGHDGGTCALARSAAPTPGLLSVRGSSRPGMARHDDREWGGGRRGRRLHRRTRGREVRGPETRLVTVNPAPVRASSGPAE